MGITGFAKFVKETWPQAVDETNLQKYEIKGRIAVDGNNEAYVYMHTCKTIILSNISNEEVMECVKSQDSRKELYNRIRALWMQRIVEFVFSDLKGNVVWVVDGKNVPNLKSDVRDTRREKIENNRKAFLEYTERLNTEDDFVDPVESRSKLIEYMCSTPPKKSDYELINYVLHRTGIPVVRAWGEGEKTCARLCMKDVPENIRCDVVWSADVDSILFGAPCLIQRMRRTQNESDARIRVIDTSRIDIKLDELIDMCIATGCDYYKKGVTRMGLKTCFKILSQGGQIPKIPETENLEELFRHHPEEKYEILKPEPPVESDEIKTKAKWLINIYHK